MEFAFIDNYTENSKNRETELIFIDLKFISQFSMQNIACSRQVSVQPMQINS